MTNLEKLKKFCKKNNVEIAIIGVSVSVLGAYFTGLYVGRKFSELTDAQVFMNRNTGEAFLHVMKASGETGRYPWEWDPDMIKYIDDKVTN